jgi:hypothetical protein
MIENANQAQVTRKWVGIFTEAIETHKRIHRSKRDQLWKPTLDSMQSQLDELQDELRYWDPICYGGLK